ncbi:hypothetical protein JL722_97 [Aureococcus anophagefferens]|nr:hypothetical protein JL722_97 [Aureococcus anophagefferens]
MEPLPRARRLYLARFFVLGGCILGLVCASTLFRPAAVEPTLLLGEGGPQGLTHGVVRGSHGYEVVLLEDADDDALLASGGYSAGASHASGFGVLKVEAAAGGADGFYAAGFLEGAARRYLTHREIVAHAINARCEIACEGRVPPRVAAFLREQEVWTAATVAERGVGPALAPRARRARPVRGRRRRRGRGGARGRVGRVRPGRRAVLGALRGDAPPEDLRVRRRPATTRPSALRMAVRLVNSIGELIDVVPAVLHPGEREDMSGTPATPKERAEADSEALANSGAAVLITVADDLRDIFFSHATWFHYAMMNRIYKHYSLPGVPGASQSFSSYPGTLSSFDDFYLIKETSLVILQTTNGGCSAAPARAIPRTRRHLQRVALGAVRPQSLPSWQRVRAANALAATGPAWASIVGRENSGTYNNQWGAGVVVLSPPASPARAYMILDLKLFEPGNALPDGLLYVVEQIPGTMVSGDATAELERGYFPSYNVPYFEEIYDKSGYPTLDARRGRKRGSASCGRDDFREIWDGDAPHVRLAVPPRQPDTFDFAYELIAP